MRLALLLTIMASLFAGCTGDGSHRSYIIGEGTELTHTAPEALLIKQAVAVEAAYPGNEA